ncbi:MAG TPA: DUF3263 domain-containing protein [Microbacterium sp.]|nr:DUF3263 domain-containing protein [Microbacterium sp.]
MSTVLSERARAILDFEEEWSAHSPAKEDAIRARLEIEPARYYQMLGRLVEDPAALAYAPMLIGRLRRMRENGSSRRANLLR